MKILIPDAAPFASLNVPEVEFAAYRRGEELPQDAEGLVLWGLPRAQRQAAFRSPALRWVLTLTAGVDHVAADLPEGVTLYNASRLHDDAVAQHAVASLLAAGRGLHLARDAQRERRWTRGSWTDHLWTLADKQVVIWGYGHIGRKLDAMLRPLGATVTGLRSGSSPQDLQAALGAADVLVLLLPATPHTRGLVNAALLSRLKRGAWLANLGRGELVVTADLLEALKAGTLGGAILDVTDPEPLPADSELWGLTNVIITPHVASSTADITERAAEFTADFLRRLTRGEELPNRVNLGKGY